MLSLKKIFPREMFFYISYKIMNYLPLSKKSFTKTFYLIVGVWVLFAFNTQAQLAGVVFKDFNNDGIQTPPNEIGLRNIIVSVFIGSSNSPLITQTEIDGTYSFTVEQVPVGSRVRVEFTGLGVNNNGKSTGQSKTNIQFLTIPSGGAEDVSLGILTNNDYCNVDGALIFTPCYVSGDPLAGGSAGEDDAFVSFPYYASGVGGTTGPMPNHIAKASEVGSLWGLDYQGRGKIVLTSAVVRRHVGLGPLGTGGIYKFNTVSSTIEPLIDVKTLGIDTGPDPHTDLPADKLLSSEDAASVAAAGTVGIGSIALSSDEKTLFMVNLYDRKLYSVFVGSPAQVPSISSVKSYAIPNPCSDGDYRPWGVKEYQGKLYLGVVCSSETAQDSTALTGTIYQFDQKTGVFSIFYQFPLTYKRGAADVTDECINIRYWRPWSNIFPKACAGFFDAEKGKMVGFAMNPQPLIADLEFDSDGSMIIGLMDRFGLALGFRALAPIDDGKLYDGFVSGDILRVYNNNGVYEMENNGQAGPLLGSGVNNDEGFGGGEFYGRDYWNFFGNPAHREISNGGLMLLPGSGEILSSAMDPVDEVYHAGGFQIFSNTDGSLLRSFAVYAGKPGTLGKSGGVGDMKANCGDAPIEIGNRVWHDINKNGIQDPNEDGIDGVTITLHDMEKGGIQLASTVTTDGGTFLFNNENVTDTVKYEHHYQIRLKMLQAPLTSLELIEVSPGGAPILPDSVENVSEMRDSDALLVKIPSVQNSQNLRNNALDNNDFAVIDFMTGATTLSNHSLDIGLSGCVPPTLVTASSNSPVNEGSAINLSATSTGGVTYSWSGPDSFSSTTQNPIIASSTLAMGGIYTVTVSGNGTCTVTATTNVIVNCVSPTNVVASSNSPVNEGSAINLTSTSTGGVSYSWAGPNGFSSTTQNPSIASSTLAMAGIYTVTVSGNGTCTATATANVIVNCVVPTNVVASSNSPVNEGAAINLTSTSTGGVSYSWKGPNGFSSTTQNPSIASSSLVMAGIYTVTVSGNGTCTTTATTNVIVNCVAPTNVIASSNSPVNEGAAINFTATSIGGKTYSWAGPNDFSSTTQNPSIASSSLVMAGIYTVTVSGNGTCTATATTNVIINCVAPTNVVASSNSPVNEGSAINLSATSTGGISYSWKGPNGFSSTTQNPSIASSTLAMGGIYTVTVSGNGTCTATATTNVIVNCVAPTNVVASSNSPINEGTAINLSATSTGGISYSWKGPNGFSSTTPNPSISSVTLAMSGIYTVTVTGNGTCAATATTNVLLFASLGDYAWFDFNQNGIQDNLINPITNVIIAPELGASFIKIDLFKVQGTTSTFVGSQITDNNGKYLFKNLEPGKYFIQFDPASYPNPNGGPSFAITTLNALGSTNANDNDIQRVIYRSIVTDLVSGENDLTWDIGLYREPDAQIGDPCGCVEKNVYISSNPTVSDPYLFSEKVIVYGTPGVPNESWVIVDSYTDPKTGITHKTRGLRVDNPAIADFIPSLNYPTPSSVGQYLKENPSGSGVFEYEFYHMEPDGYEMVVFNGFKYLFINAACKSTPELYDSRLNSTCAYGQVFNLQTIFPTGTATYYYVQAGEIAYRENFDESDLIDPSKNPQFTGIPVTQLNPKDFVPGSTHGFYVKWVPKTDINNPNPKATTCPKTIFVNVTFGLGSECVAEIGDFVWEDKNKNGVQDIGENGIPNVAVTLLDANGVVVTKDAIGNSLLGKATDANGFYQFIKLPPGDYKIQFGKPEGYSATIQDALVGTDASDSDADLTTGISQKVTLTNGERNATIDAGFYLTCVPPTNVTASSNVRVNEGEAIKLKATSTGGTSYSWTGPNGYFSSLQNPTIASAARYMAGEYTVTVLSSANCSSNAKTTVEVVPICQTACVPIKVKKLK